VAKRKIIYELKIEGEKIIYIVLNADNKNEILVTNLLLAQ